MDSAGSPWLVLLLLWPSLGVEVMLEEDVLLCNASSSAGDVRKYRLEGYLFPNDLVRSMANSIKFDFVPSESLWSPEVKSFCDVMELSSSRVTGRPPVSVQPVAYLSGHVLLTFLPFETGHVAEGGELRCFSEDLWMRHVHSVGQLGLVIIYPKGSDQPVNVTNLFLTIKGVRFPFLFVPFMRWSTEVIDTTKILQDLFNDFSNVSCSLAAKGDGDGKALDSLLNSFSRTSVLFVSVSFIILMIISLAWLVFYYVQRFRYAHAKDRLAHRLFNAARKTLSKLPVKTVHSTNGEPIGDCPVCIEPFHNGDVVRTLLCKHAFHKTCVDPWLLQHRTCPLCKLDILKAIGYTFKVSEESVRDDAGNALGRSIEAAVTGLRHPLASGSDFHDSLFPTPTPSPPPVQQVLRPQDTHCYTIIPMTVHSSSNNRAKRQKDVTVSGEAESHNTCHPNVQITVTNFDSPSSGGSRDQSEQMQISRVTAEPTKGNAVSTYFQISVTPFGIGLSGKRRNRSSDCRQPGSLEKGSSRTAAKQVAAKRVQA